MFEHLKILAYKSGDLLTCHRALHTGLAACHAWGAVQAHDPGLYGAMALLYAVMAVRK